MTGAELHAHTTASDGTFTPLEAVDHASQLGLAALAITDHDTLAGVSEATLGAQDLSVEIIPGVEISCEHYGAPVHLLAYWPDLSHAELSEELANIRESRRERAQMMVEKLQKLGHRITLEQVMSFAKGGNPGRPHVAEALVEIGAIASVNDAFTDALIGTGGAAYVPKYSLEPHRAVQLVREANGVPVLAHPGIHRGKNGVPDELIVSLASIGLLGIEAGHFDHDDAMKAKYLEMADRLSLIATAGSDCHGDLHDPVRMGSATASMEVVEALRSVRGV